MTEEKSISREYIIKEISNWTEWYNKWNKAGRFPKEFVDNGRILLSWCKGFLELDIKGLKQLRKEHNQILQIIKKKK